MPAAQPSCSGAQRPPGRRSQRSCAVVLDHVDGLAPSPALGDRNTGIGIELEAQSRFFEPFTQAESYTVRRFGGTGLGSSIARRLVDMMSGQLELRSELGKDSTFGVTLPLGLPPP